MILSAIFSGIILLREPFKRRIELSLYILPKMLNSIWNLLRNSQNLPNLKYDEILIFAISIGIISISIKSGIFMENSYVSIIEKILN